MLGSAVRVNPVTLQGVAAKSGVPRQVVRDASWSRWFAHAGMLFATTVTQAGDGNVDTPPNVTSQTEVESRSRPESRLASSGRSNLLALAMTTGLVVFLIFDAVPGGPNGLAGFVIGFGAVIGFALVSVLVVLHARYREAVAEQSALFIARALMSFETRQLDVLVGRNLLRSEDINVSAEEPAVPPMPRLQRSREELRG